MIINNKRKEKTYFSGLSKAFAKYNSSFFNKNPEARISKPSPIIEL